MNQVVVFFVPTGATQRDFEAALHEQFPSLGIGDFKPQTNEVQTELSDADELPMWTWFIPNPCP